MYIAFFKNSGLGDLTLYHIVVIVVIDIGDAIWWWPQSEIAIRISSSIIINHHQSSSLCVLNTTPTTYLPYSREFWYSIESRDLTIAILYTLSYHHHLVIRTEATSSFVVIAVWCRGGIYEGRETKTPLQKTKKKPKKKERKLFSPPHLLIFYFLNEISGMEEET